MKVGNSLVIINLTISTSATTRDGKLPTKVLKCIKVINYKTILLNLNYIYVANVSVYTMLK